MRLECIDFKRCCFCIPLRYGLLTAGYFKLVYSLIMLWGVISLIVHFALNFDQKERPISAVYPSLIGIAVLTIVLLGESALTIVFIVGGHKKDPKLMKVYYYYSIVLLGLFVIAFLVMGGSEIYSFIMQYGFLYSLFILRASIVLELVYIGFQAYMILLTRSEIAKLENNCSFKFVNNAAEGECTMVKELCEDGTYRSSKPEAEGESNEKSSKGGDTIETVNENEVDQTKKNGNYTRLV